MMHGCISITGTKRENEREDRNTTKTYLDTKLPISKCQV